MSDHDTRRVWTEDELDSALDAFNADVRTDEPVLAEARAALMALVERGESDPFTEEDRAHRAAGEQSVGQRPVGRSVGRWAAGVAAVAVLVAGALVAQTASFDGAARATAEAVQTLDLAAARSVGAVDEPVAPGRYRYVATHAWWMASTTSGGREYARLVENLIRTWVPADPRGEWLLRRAATGNRQWVVGTEDEAKAAGVDPGGPWPEGEWRAPCGDFFTDEKCGRPGGWNNPTPEWQASLPTDPDELFERLRDDASGRGEGAARVLDTASAALSSGLVVKDVRANIFKALTRLPGLEVTERQADLGGRVGIALGVDDGTHRRDLIIDPGTGQVIGERDVVTRDLGDVKAGTVLSFTSVTTGVVDTIGAEPVR